MGCRECVHYTKTEDWEGFCQKKEQKVNWYSICCYWSKMKGIDHQCGDCNFWKYQPKKNTVASRFGLCQKENPYSSLYEAKCQENCGFYIPANNNDIEEEDNEM